MDQKKRYLTLEKMKSFLFVKSHYNLISEVVPCHAGKNGSECFRDFFDASFMSTPSKVSYDAF